MITQEYLKSILHYNPETGLFIRNISIKGRLSEAGMIAGTKKFKWLYFNWDKLLKAVQEHEL